MKTTNLILFLFLIGLSSFAQPKGTMIDRVIGVVGEDVVLRSDFERQFNQYIEGGTEITDNTRCQVYEDLMVQALMLNQSKLDSVEISEAQVENELDRRMQYFIQQFGSEKKMEEFYQKTIGQIKDDFYDAVEEQLLVQTVQSKITSGVKVSPADVRDFFETIPKDSLPYISSEIEYSHIVRKPVVSEAEKKVTKDKLNKIRERILKGEDFGTLAFLYSEDPGSARKNGELGFMPRSAFVPEFAAAGFKLNPGEMSEIIETDFGYHIIELIARRGEEANLRHILIKTTISNEAISKAKNYVDSVYKLIETIDTLTFEDAAIKFSDDKDSKNNGGKVINPYNNTPRWDMEQVSEVDPSAVFIIDKLEVGKVSSPAVYQMQDGTTAYRIIMLKKRTAPHQANLKDDYQRIQEIALLKKQEKVMIDWINKRAEKVYYKIDDEFSNCDFSANWKIETKP